MYVLPEIIIAKLRLPSRYATIAHAAKPPIQAQSRALPDIEVESAVERRIRLNFSGNERPLIKEGFIDLRADLQAQFSAYAKRCAIGNLPAFFVGTANPAELCLHGFYRSQLEKYLKSYEK